jgi:hypothetical protein
VQQHLRNCFERWGLPKAIRVDNGDPWATRSDVPSALALWLVGLGVKVVLNRPYRSTDNGIVERGHGVLSKWVEAHQAHDDRALQKQLDWAVTMQRERYPACGGKTRLQAYPDLIQSNRPYRQSDEPHLWQFERVQAFLADFVWTRRVDKVGRVSIFSSAYSVGRAYVGQEVHIHLDSNTHQWVIETEQGQCLKRYACQEITPERIYAFDLSKRANKAAHHAG